MYTVLETGSKQYKAAPGDLMEVERLAAEPGKDFSFDRVLLVNRDGQVSIGTPVLDNARVVVDVVKHIRGSKKTAFKMKRRKGYHRTVGHRQELTVVKVREITL